MCCSVHLFFFRSSWWVWVKRGLIALSTLYVATPFILQFFPSVIQYLVYKHAGMYICYKYGRFNTECHLCSLLHPQHCLSLFSNILCWLEASLWSWSQSHRQYVPDLRSRSDTRSMVSCAFCKSNFTYLLFVLTVHGASLGTRFLNKSGRRLKVKVWRGTSSLWGMVPLFSSTSMAIRATGGNMYRN